MTVAIMMAFEDGARRLVRRFDTVEEAVDYAFGLAEGHATDQHDPDGRPDRIQMEVDGRVELSIRVLSGGLATSSDG